jgi:hypothetical protein
MIHRLEMEPFVLAECRGFAPQVIGDIPDVSLENANELSLGFL